MTNPLDHIMAPRERAGASILVAIEKSELEPGMQRLLRDILDLYIDRPVHRVAGPGSGQRTAVQLILDYCENTSGATHEGVFGPVSTGWISCQRCGSSRVRIHPETLLTQCCGAGIGLNPPGSDFSYDGPLSPRQQLHYEIATSSLPDAEKARLLGLLAAIKGAAEGAESLLPG